MTNNQKESLFIILKLVREGKITDNEYMSLLDSIIDFNRIQYVPYYPTWYNVPTVTTPTYETTWQTTSTVSK